MTQLALSVEETIAAPLDFDYLKAVWAGEVGMDDARRAARVQAWKDAADAWLELLPAGREFTADDLVRAIGLPDFGVARNNVVGAWTSAKSKAGRIVWTGTFRKSERVVGHGNLQRVWRVA